MQALKIPGKKATPSVHFDKDQGIFEITGNAYPQDAVGFFLPIQHWFDQYCQDPNPETHMVFQLDYYHSATKKSLFKLISNLMKLDAAGSKVTITWRYKSDDEETESDGEELKEMLTFPIHMEVM